MSNLVTQFMLNTLITSKTRLKLLFKFFLNKDAVSYLRGLSSEFGESSNAIRLELNNFENAGLLKSRVEGNKKLFQANTEHPLFDDIHSILKKQLGFDMLINKVVKKIGDLEAVFVIGDLAQGKDSEIIDLIMNGEKLDRSYINNLIEKAEKLIKRKIRFIVFNKMELENYLSNHGPDEVFLLWKR